jgi:hypothetical protein
MTSLSKTRIPHLSETLISRIQPPKMPMSMLRVFDQGSEASCKKSVQMRRAPLSYSAGKGAAMEGRPGEKEELESGVVESCGRNLR